MGSIDNKDSLVFGRTIIQLYTRKKPYRKTDINTEQSLVLMTDFLKVWDGRKERTSKQKEDAMTVEVLQSQLCECHDSRPPDLALHLKASILLSTALVHTNPSII